MSERVKTTIGDEKEACLDAAEVLRAQGYLDQAMMLEALSGNSSSILEMLSWFDFQDAYNKAESNYEVAELARLYATDYPAFVEKTKGRMSRVH